MLCRLSTLGQPVHLSGIRTARVLADSNLFSVFSVVGQSKSSLKLIQVMMVFVSPLAVTLLWLRQLHCDLVELQARSNFRII